MSPEQGQSQILGRGIELELFAYNQGCFTHSRIPTWKAVLYKNEHEIHRLTTRAYFIFPGVVSKARINIRGYISLTHASLCLYAAMMKTACMNSHLGKTGGKQLM